MEDIKKQFEDYKLFARAEIPVILFTVMLWSSLQAIIGAAVESYAPGMRTWQLAMIEIMIASFGLWCVQRGKKEVDASGEIRDREPG